MATTISVENAPGSGVYVDLTSYLRQGSLTVKVNTVDFELINPPATSTQLGAGIRLTDPTWTGTVAAAMTADATDLRTGNIFVTVTGTNALALPLDTAPYDLSDLGDVNATTNFELEDGSGHIVLENGTDWAPGILLTEGALTHGYAGLSVQRQVNPTAGGPPQTLGRATVSQPGLRPGNQFGLTSFNQGYSGTQFQITQLTTTFPELAANPFFQIEFGDTPQTLATWTLAHAAPVVAPVVPPVVAVIPAGPVTYGTARTGYALYAMGGGVVTIASASFSVSAPIGHTLTVQVQGAIDVRTHDWDNYVAAPRRGVRAILSGGIYTGAWQETPFGFIRNTYDVSSAAGIALASGTYTVSLQINTVEYNRLEVFSGWVQTAVTVV